MKKKLVFISLISFLTSFLFGQETIRYYSWEEALKVSKDSVKAISFAKLKLDSLPNELYQFTDLLYLDISKNKFKTLPNDLGKLNKLILLDASKNNLTSVVTVCQLTQLKSLLLARNEITQLPNCIGFLSELKSLDIWDNPIASLPEDFGKLTNLKAVDMRGILLSPTFQETWKAKLPNTKWEFDAPCNCVR